MSSFVDSSICSFISPILGKPGSWKWYKQALEMLEQEGTKDKKLKSKVSPNLSDVKERHDGHIMTEGLRTYFIQTLGHMIKI